MVPRSRRITASSLLPEKSGRGRSFFVALRSSTRRIKERTSMQAMIDELAKQAAESLGQVSGKETLASFWQEYLSKNGKIPALMKNLRTVAPETPRFMM